MNSDSTTKTTSYPVPSNESDRVKRLHQLNILDTEHEQSFDRLTELASSFFDVPIALISLLDEERLWFKSATGVDKRQSKREYAFCNYVLVDDEVVIITDATEDKRVDDNPLVTGESNIRSYAGAPLRTEDGFVIGTFCVMDRQPRQFSEREIQVLQLLASETMDQIRLRERNQVLEDTQAELEQALDGWETLIHETHHRVKNNFTVIDSFLSMKIRETNNEDTIESLKDIQRKIQSMMELHRELSQTDGTTTVQSEQYLHKLAMNMLENLSDNPPRLNPEFRLENHEISGKIATKFGLILNELLANVHEHAYPDRDVGTVTVELTVEDETATLSISDEGVGFSEDPLNSTNPTQGLGLVKTLAEKQLEGTFEIEDDAGVTVEVCVPHRGM